MSIKFNCPKCNKSFMIKNDYGGKKAKCSCGKIINIPLEVDSVQKKQNLDPSKQSGFEICDPCLKALDTKKCDYRPIRKVIFVIVSVVIATALLIFSLNFLSLSPPLSGVVKLNPINLSLSKPLSDVIKSDPRNSGINMQAHYRNCMVPSVLVLDIQDVSGDKSAADVFRVFLQYANKIKDKEFDTVELASNGTTKFFLKGDYFKKLGDEYTYQNPIYTMRTFCENIYKPDGSRAFDSWTGGILGVMGKQMEDFNEFHKQWYIEDIN